MYIKGMANDLQRVKKQDILVAIREAKHPDGSRGVAYIPNTKVTVEVEGVRNMPRGGAMAAWSYVYTLIDPLYQLNGGKCYGQRGQASFVAAAFKWLNSEKRNGN
jgi:hypothetical protein